MKFRTEGLIIREQNIGEQDKLIFVLTKSHGVVKAFARGAKSLKSGKGAATALLSYSLLTFYEGRESYSVSDVRSLRVFSRPVGSAAINCSARSRLMRTLRLEIREPNLVLHSMWISRSDRL